MPPGGVAPRFEQHPETAAWISNTNGFDRFADGGWMVREIVEHRDALGLATNFEAPFDIRKALEPSLNFFDGNATDRGDSDYRQRITDIDLAGERKKKAAEDRGP